MSKSLHDQAKELFEMAARCTNKQMAQALTMQAHALLNLAQNGAEPPAVPLAQRPVGIERR